jgi:transketolase
MHAGVSVGPDGATHQMLEDIGMMRMLPGMTVISPCDAVEAEKAVIAGEAPRSRCICALAVRRRPFLQPVIHHLK